MPKNTLIKNKKGLTNLNISIINAIIGGVICAILGSLITFALSVSYNKANEEPDIKNYKIADIQDWYKNINNNLDAEKLAHEKFYGNYVRWEGEIKKLDNSIYGEVTVYFDDFIAKFNNSESIKDLTNGYYVIVQGQIASISEYAITLNNCKVIHISDMKKDTEENQNKSETSITQNSNAKVITEDKIEFIKISAKDIYNWYNNFDNELDAYTLAKIKYIGKYIQWDGTIIDISPGTSGENEFTLTLMIKGYNDKKIKNPVGIYINYPFLFVFVKGLEQAHSLKVGDEIKISGKIFNIYSTGISISNGKVIKNE